SAFYRLFRAADPSRSRLSKKFCVRLAVMRVPRVGVILIGAPVCFALSLGVSLRVACCILDVAPGLLGLALCLLHCALDLRIGIAGPLAYLAFCTARGIVDRTFYCVLIHIDSTSVDWGFYRIAGRATSVDLCCDLEQTT